MQEKAGDTGVVSWELFNDLYENQFDFFRKLRFIIKAGKVDNSESMALEMIEDYLKRKEAELKDLRQAGLEEWSRRGRITRLHRIDAGKMPGNGGGKGPHGPPVPAAPANRASFWSRTLSRMKAKQV